MKRLHVALLAAMIAILCSSDIMAQQRLFGNGRFLKRVRDELTGQSKTPPKKPSQSKKPTAAKDKTPTPAKPKAKKPATNEVGSGKAPTTARPNNPKQPELVQGENASFEATRSNEKTTKGFGMLVQKQGDQLVVTAVDPKGNAHDSGLRRGDKIAKIGGVELKSLNEYNDIADILREGDQIEMHFERKGNSKKALVQLGKAPDPNEVAPGKTVEPIELTTGTKPRSATAGTKPSGNQSYLNTIQRQQQQIEQMQRELERLRQNAPDTSPRTGSRSVLDVLPTLSGPGL